MSDVKWTHIITGNKKILNLNIKELLHYRDLIFLFVKRDFISIYQQSLLGPLWYIIQPILSTIVFTVIFGKIANIPTDGMPQPIFYLSGLTIWNYFSSCLTSNSTVFIQNSAIFGKVYFPRLTVPISIVISNFIKFLVQFALFIGLFLFYMSISPAIKPNLMILFTPVLVLQAAALGLGCGILISSLTTKYRDLNFLVQFGVQLWMYATPIVYPISQVHGKLKLIFIINPMSPIVEAFRYAYLGVGSVNWFNLILSSIITILIILSGIFYFSNVEKSFMDRV